MATVGEVTVKISADLASLRSAYAEAQKATSQLDKSLNASAKSAGAVFGQQWTTNFNQVSASVNSATANIGQLSSVFSKAESGASGFGDQVKKTSDAMKVFGDTEKQINNATRNLTFQFNDIFSGLASGIPVTQVFAQQITQITQLLKPGTGLVGALQGLGSALVSFFINPINLAVVAIGAATIAIPKIWSAVTGGEAESAESLLERVNNLLKEMAETSPKVEEALKRIGSGDALGNPARQARELTDATQDAGKAQVALKQEILSMAQSAQASYAIATSGALVVPQATQAMVNLTDQVAKLAEKYASGQITAAEFGREINQIKLPPEADETATAFIARIDEAIQRGETLESVLLRASTALSNAETSITNTEAAFSDIGSVNWNTFLNSDQLSTAIKQAKGEVSDFTDILKDNLGISREADFPIPGTRPNPESRSPEKTNSRGAASAWRNENTIENLTKQNASIQQQIALYGQEYDVRQKGLLQLQTEEKIRAAIRSLGPKATQEQIAAVTQLITAQAELNNQLKAAQAISDISQENSDLQQQISLYSLSYEERMKGIAALEAEQRIRQLGISSTGEQADKIRQLIAAQQELNGQLKQQEAVQQAVNNVYSQLGSSAGGALKGLIDGTKSWNEALGDIIVSLTKAVLQASLLQTFGNGQGGLTSAGGFLSALVGAFDTGGYTGNGGKYEPAGIVHKGEYVFSKEATNRLGAANLDAMHQAAKRGYAAGGMVASGIGVNNYGVSQRSGSIGAGNRTRGGEEITVRSYFDDNGNFKTAVERIAKPVSKQVSSEQIGQFNTVLPDRIRQIDNNPRRR